MIDRITQIGIEMAALEKEEREINTKLANLEETVGVTDDTTDEEYYDLLSDNETYQELMTQIDNIEEKISYLEKEQTTLEEDEEYGYS